MKSSNPFGRPAAVRTSSPRANPFKRRDPAASPSTAQSPTAALFREIRRRREAEEMAAAARALAQSLKEQLRHETDRLADGKAKGAERARKAAEAGKMRLTRNVVQMGRESDRMRTKMQVLEREARERDDAHGAELDMLRGELAEQAETMARLRESIRAVMVGKERELADFAKARALLQEKLAEAKQKVVAALAEGRGERQSVAEQRTAQLGKERKLREALRKERAEKRALNDALVEAESANSAMRQKMTQMSSAGAVRARPRSAAARPPAREWRPASRSTAPKSGRGRKGGRGRGAKRGSARAAKRDDSSSGSSDESADEDALRAEALALEWERSEAALRGELDAERAQRAVERDAANAARTMVASELQQTAAAHRAALDDAESVSREFNALKDRLALRSDHFASMVEENDAARAEIAARAEQCVVGCVARCANACTPQTKTNLKASPPPPEPISSLVSSRLVSRLSLCDGREIAAAKEQSRIDTEAAEMQTKLAHDALTRLSTLERALVRHNIDSCFLVEDVPEEAGPPPASGKLSDEPRRGRAPRQTQKQRRTQKRAPGGAARAASTRRRP